MVKREIDCILVSKELHFCPAVNSGRTMYFFCCGFFGFSDKTMMVWASGTFQNDCIKVNEEKILKIFGFAVL